MSPQPHGPEHHPGDDEHPDVPAATDPLLLPRPPAGDPPVTRRSRAWPAWAGIALAVAAFAACLALAIFAALT